MFGPRGTGKTTWVKRTFKEGIYLDLLEARLYNELLADPQRLENYIPSNFKDWIVIDEVQRIPEILNEVHRLIENNHYKFVLTGSSARKLKRKGPNLLAGRALTYFMHPLTVPELSRDFSLKHSLLYGNLPPAYTEDKPGEFLESYIQTYLQEEVRQEGLTRNLGAFARFMESASFSQGEVLNISEVARESSVGRKVVENYFTVLEDLMIAYRIPVFTKRAKRRLVSHPKFYYFDVGIYRTIRPMGPLDSPEEAEGIAFESLFFQEAMAINDYLKLGYKVYYWRTSNGQEVDFVLYGKRGILAFEIKRRNKITAKHNRGLRSFLEDYPEARAYLIYNGNRILREGNIKILPIQYTLENLAEILKQQ